jgi:hypothetical protein
LLSDYDFKYMHHMFSSGLIINYTNVIIIGKLNFLVPCGVKREEVSINCFMLQSQMARRQAGAVNYLGRSGVWVETSLKLVYTEAHMTL